VPPFGDFLPKKTMLVQKWKKTIQKKEDSQNMTTFPPKKETQVFDNFLFLNEKI
jgi:hypothetical protein